MVTTVIAVTGEDEREVWRSEHSLTRKQAHGQIVGSAVGRGQRPFAWEPPHTRAPGPGPSESFLTNWTPCTVHPRSGAEGVRACAPFVLSYAAVKCASKPRLDGSEREVRPQGQ